MKTIADINNELEKIDNEIEETSSFLTDTREDYLTKKAEYEIGVARSYLTAKAQNQSWTESMLKAFSITENEVKRMEFITSESAYRKVQNKSNQLRDKFDSLKEQSYNLRADLRKL